MNCLMKGIEVLKQGLFIMLFVAWKAWGEPLQTEIGAESVLLINADTGKILFEKNAYTLRYPASTTKMATALYALKIKEPDLNQVIKAPEEALLSLTQEAKKKSNYTVPGYWLEPDGTTIGLKKDEEMTLRDLLKGILIVSGNDAANVMAQALGGTIPQFMTGLNTYLKELGCQNTHFCNPHGLHHPQHQTTAYDLALIAREALKNPTFCEMACQPYFKRPKTNLQKSVTLLHTNALIRPGKHRYPKAIGIKSGYHAKAKNNFVGAASYENRTLILVLMGYPKRSDLFDDAIKLFELAFNQPKVHHTFLKAGPQNFQQHLAKANRPIQTYLAENLSLDYYPAEDPCPKCFLYWDPLTLPIHKGQKVGELHLVKSDGDILKKISLLAADSVAFKWPHNWIAGVQLTWNDSPLFLIVLCLSALTTFILSIQYLRKMK